MKGGSQICDGPTSRPGPFGGFRVQDTFLPIVLIKEPIVDPNITKLMRKNCSSLKPWCFLQQQKSGRQGSGTRPRRYTHPNHIFELNPISNNFYWTFCSLHFRHPHWLNYGLLEVIDILGKLQIFVLLNFKYMHTQSPC